MALKRPRTPQSARKQVAGPEPALLYYAYVRSAKTGIPGEPMAEHSGSVQLQPFKLSRIPVGVIMHFGLNPNNNARDVIHNIFTTPECPWRIVHDAPYAMLITLIPEQTWNSFATVAEREWRNRSVAAPRINGNGSTSLSAALERHGHAINFPA